MAAEVFGFDRAGTKRVVDAVRKVENLPEIQRVRPRPPSRRSPRGTLRGKLYEDLVSGGVARVTIWDLDNAAAAADAVEAETTEVIADVRVWTLPSGKKLESGKMVYIEWISGRYRSAWYVTGYDGCPVSA